MKVLQVNCVYNKGSTGKITHEIHEELKRNGHSSIVCYGRGEKTEEPYVYKTCGEFYSKLQNFRSRLTGLMYGGCAISTIKLINIIKKENPDVVHLHCINGYFVNIYKLVEWLKCNNVRTVLTLHAEFMHTANCGHAFDCEEWKTGCNNCARYKEETKSILFNRTHSSWKKMKKAFDGFNNLIVVSVSPWLMGRAKQSPILADKKHCVVLNGLDTNIFKNYDTHELRSMHGLKNEKLIFHVTPSFSREKNHLKGGYYVLKLAERLADNNVKILVAGKYDVNIHYPSNVVLLGEIQEQELLAKYYSMADITVLASKKETFSMVCAESLCCGTPVVGFNAGAPEQISIPGFSSFVEYGNIDALEKEVLRFLQNKVDKKEISKLANQKYNDRQMIKEYFEIYKG